MNQRRAQLQLAAIAELVNLAHGLDTPVWLRGGWAVDFYLGRITRDHADIDWFALNDDAANLADALASAGYKDVTTAPVGQQLDVANGAVEHGIALIRLGINKEPLVGGGPWAGQPWPQDMLNGPICHIGEVKAHVISPRAQMEIKRMMPTWNPGLHRRQQDLDDIAAIHAAQRGSA